MAKISINIKEGKIDKVSDIIVGIDLGTTNSLVAYIKDGKAEAVKGSNGKVRSYHPSFTLEKREKL